MAEDFEEFKEKVREANRIEDVIPELGFPLKIHGRDRAYGTRDDCNTLHVLIGMQHAWWYGDNWHGDVFGFVQKVKGWDFMASLEFLAARAGLRMPEFKKMNEEELRQRAATADAFTVAAAVFQSFLLGKEDKATGKKIAADAKALEYVRGRGWTDETTRLAMTGFSGRRADWQLEEMRGEMQLWGVNVESPAAVAVLGFRGDVQAWAAKWNVTETPAKWLDENRISGLMGTPGVVYCHQRFGKVEYLSRRQLPGFDMIKGEDGKERPWKSYNPHRALVGEKKPYYNHAYAIGKPCVMVEGQGDAKSLGQWGQGGMALLGTLDDFERKSPEEQEKVMQWVAKMWKHPALYYWPDADEPGMENARKIGRLFGAKLRIVRPVRLVRRDETNNVEGTEVSDGE